VHNGHAFARGDRGSKAPAHLFGGVKFPEPAPLGATEASAHLIPALKFPFVAPSEIKPQLNGNWHIKGLMPSRGLMTVYAPPGAGKSFITLAAVLHVAAGRRFASRKVMQAGVVYIAGEGRGGFRNRLLHAAERLGTSLHNIPFRLIEVTPNLGTSEADRKCLENDVEVQTAPLGWKPGIVVIDTLASTMHGADENTSQGMGRFLANAESLVQKFDCLVIAVHHAGKDEARGMRGWSGLHASCDCEWEVTKGTAERSHSVRLQKVRDGRAGLSWTFNLIPVPVGFDEDGDPVTTCVVEIIGDPALAKNSKDSRQTPKHRSRSLVAFDNAFEEAMSATGEEYKTTEGQYVKAVTREAVRSHFCWAPEESDANKRRKKTSGAFTSVLKLLSEQSVYCNETVSSIQRVWRAEQKIDLTMPGGNPGNIAHSTQIGEGDQNCSEGEGPCRSAS